MKAIARRERFKIVPFVNQRTGSKSWRVCGIKRDRKRVRENFADVKSAECRKIQLTAEWLARETEVQIKATKLTDVQLKLAELAFARLDDDEEIVRAVDYWRKHGKAQHVEDSPRIDDAFEEFAAWLKTTPTLRDRTKNNLHVRANLFANSVPNLRVSEVRAEDVERYLDGRSKVSAATRDNDRRALSRFFSWCIERPRRWASANPCRGVKVEQGEKAPPQVLSVDECKALLRAAEGYRDGHLAPYAAVCLFAGLRPFEARRLTWAKVNLNDGEIRLEGNETKTGRPRVVTICKTLRWWLEKYRGKEFDPPNWRKDFDAVKLAAGFAARKTVSEGKKPWIEDVMRHTAISHYFRNCGSYGQTADQFGNSEAIIKNFYQGRVTTEETREFYSIKPGGKR